MGITKKNALKQLNNMGSNVSNQQSLVRKLAGPQIQKPIRHVIPGGKHLTESISQDQLPGTVWTWLRRVRHFKDVHVMLCSDYEKRDNRVSTVVDFDSNARLPEWETQGKKWLAERITEVLVMDNILGVKVDKRGVHAIQDVHESFNEQSDDWEPNLVFTPHKPSAF